MQNFAYRILIADDHPLFRGALRQILEQEFTALKIFESGDLTDTDSILSVVSDIDIVFLDLTMPGSNGFSALSDLRQRYPAIPVLIVSAREEASTIKRCIEFGASAYIPKSLDVSKIKFAINEVIAGRTWFPETALIEDTEDSATLALVDRLATLTPQQKRVLRMLADGMLNKQIAFTLKVSEATIKAHVSAILQKLSVESRTQAVIAVSKIDPVFWNEAESGSEAHSNYN